MLFVFFCYVQSLFSLTPLPFKSIAWSCVSHWAADKIWKSGCNPKRGSHKETVRWGYGEPWLFAQRITQLMWINWTRDCPDSLFPLQSLLLSEEGAKARSCSVHEFNPWPYQPHMCVWIYMSEVLLGSQGGSHLSTKLCFGGRLALTCTGESWHTLY